MYFSDHIHSFLLLPANLIIIFTIVKLYHSKIVQVKSCTWFSRLFNLYNF